MAIPMTVIWATLNRFVSSVLDLGLEIGREFFEQISDGRFLFSRPLWSRRDETTSKNLGRLFGRCRVTDGRLPTLHLDKAAFLVDPDMVAECECLEGIWN